MKTFEFTDEQRHELIEIFVHGTIQELLSRIEQIVSERITPEPGSKSRERIVLERLLDKIKEAQSQGANYAIENEDVVAIALVLSINSPSAPITPEPGESGQINAKWDELERTFNNKPFAPIDSTESGQSADGGIAIMEILQPIHRHPFDAESGREMEIWYTHKDVWNAMTTYASQVCADKEREMGLLKNELAKAKEEIEKSHMDKIYSIHDLKSELSAANESLTVMVRKNAELEEIHINNKIELGSRQKRIFELESEISKLNPLSSFKTK